MQGVLHSVTQLVNIVAGKCVDQPGHSTDIEHGFLARDGVTEHATSRGGLADGLGDEAHALQARRDIHALSHPSRSSVDTQLDATIQGRSHTTTRYNISVNNYTQRNVSDCIKLYENIG